MSHVAKLIADAPTGWLEWLVETHKINVTRDGDLVSLKYNQIESPMHEPIVQECRGMVVCTRRNKILAWPYNKFWNHGEHLADEIDWNSARVLEKLDGSLMILYWDEQWCVASSGHPTAGGSFGATERTFRDAFWQTWRDLGCDLTAADPCLTYMFELCDAPNRVVVRHDKPRLVLHGARAMDDGEEVGMSNLPDEARALGVELVRSFPLRTLAEAMSAAETMDPLQQEGFVIVDDQGHRVKLKSPRYVILHHLKGEMSQRRAIELWQTGDTSELLTHFPEFRVEVEAVHSRLDIIAHQAARDFEENLPRPTRKEFAMAVKHLPWSAVLFRMLGEPRGNEVDTAKTVMRGLGMAALERMLEQ